MAEQKLTDKTFQFELVSPDEVLFSEQVSMVTIPGEVGEFGVLANHAPILSAIKPGVVCVTLPDGAEKNIFVAGGFADVNDNVCAVLAEEAINVNDIDAAAVDRKISDLEIRLERLDADENIKAIRMARDIDLAKAKRAAVG